MSSSKPDFNKNDIAPCGINCASCMAFLRRKNQCRGCRSVDGTKRVSCQNCAIFKCSRLAETTSGFCYECVKFPCQRLKHLDKRYTIKYKTSLIGNLRSIEKMGMDAYLQLENIARQCPKCGSTICIHTGECSKCQK
jgi:hypothetical protein